MSKTLKSLRRGIKAGIKAAAEPINSQRKYKAAGKRVRCTHCGGEIFESAPPLPGMLSWPTIQCVSCSHLESFGREDALVEEIN
jgi:ribosomal protein S27E